jgi:hypothetical protein
MVKACAGIKVGAFGSAGIERRKTQSESVEFAARMALACCGATKAL